MNQENQGSNNAVFVPPQGRPIDVPALRVRKVTRTHFEGMLDDDGLARVSQAAEEVLLSVERIRNEHYIIGAQLSYVRGIILSAISETITDPHLASLRTSERLGDWGEAAMGMKRKSLRVYLAAHERYNHKSEAISAFSISELDILTRKDITDDEFDAVHALKLSDKDFKRTDIRPFLKKLRSTQTALYEAESKLDLANEAITETIASQQDQSFQIRDLQAEVTRLTKERDQGRESLSAAQVDLAKANASTSRLNMEVDQLTREQADLERRLEATRTNPPVKTIEVEVVPPALGLLEDALATLTAKISEAKHNLSQAHEERAAIQQDIIQQRLKVDAHNKVTTGLIDLIGAVEGAISKVPTVQMMFQMDPDRVLHRDSIATLTGVVARLHQDLNACLEAI